MIPQPETIKKKWILVWHVPFKAKDPVTWASYVEVLKKEFSNDFMEEFFETKILQMFTPTERDDFKIEVHEIVLSHNGYDKFDIMLQDTNLTAQQVLEKLKEAIDVQE